LREGEYGLVDGEEGPEARDEEEETDLQAYAHKLVVMKFNELNQSWFVEVLLFS